MSSRILTGSATVAALPIAWRKPYVEPLPDLSPAPAEKAGGALEAHPDLESRMQELQQLVHTESASAYERGVREGEEQEQRRSGAGVQAGLERMSKSIRDLAELRPRLRRDAESDVVQMAIAIARRILHREMSVDPSSMQALVKVALDKLGRQDICRVRVYPGQATAIRSYLEAASSSTIEVIPDAAREMGSLVFETNHGKLDASVSAQLEEIERGLTDRMEKS